MTRALLYYIKKTICAKFDFPIRIRLLFSNKSLGNLNFQLYELSAFHVIGDLKVYLLFNFSRKKNFSYSSLINSTTLTSTAT